MPYKDPEKERENSRQYRASHLEEKREYAREYRLAHLDEEYERGRKRRAEHPEEIREYNRKYVAEHPEETLENQREYRAAHPEKKSQYNRKYRATHPDKARESVRNSCATEHGKVMRVARQHNRRVKLKGIRLTADTIADVKANFGGFCPYCWEKIETGHIDHVVPISKGGTNERNNLAWVCETCNMQKGNKSLAEFRLYQQVTG